MNDRIFNIIKNIIIKSIIFVILLIIGILLGSIYGIIHDQISYSISNEYYIKFKFIQFGIINLPDRFSVSIVGIFATWWMGLIIGFILGITGLIHKDYKKMLKCSLQSFIITILIAFIVGIIGLFYGFIYLSNQPLEYFQNWFIPNNLENFKNFIAVGSMHNFSYLGGLIGMIIGIIWQFIKKNKK